MATSEGRKFVVPARSTRIFRRVSQPVMKPVGLYATIEVLGRHSSSPRTVTVSPINVDGVWYVCSFSGDSDWARNLRSAGTATFIRRGRRLSVAVIEVDGRERDDVQAKYRRVMGPLRRDFDRLPLSADHPTFKLKEAPPG